MLNVISLSFASSQGFLGPPCVPQEKHIDSKIAIISYHAILIYLNIH